jgi:hypothetical protein
MPIFASNFSSNSLVGTVRVTNGFANITLPTIPYTLEGDKTFVIKLRKDNQFGDVLATSPTLTFRDNSSFVSLTANLASVTEGNLISFTVVTANTVNGANLFFSVFPATANVTSADFTSNTGMVTIVNNTGTFALRANADLSLMDETGENFRVQLRTTDALTGNIVYNTSNIAIIDYSKGYGVITFSPTALVFYENDSMRFQLQTYNAANAVLYYTTTGGNAAASNFVANNAGLFTVGADNFSNITLTANTNIPIDETRTFQLQVKVGDVSGPVLATSDLVTIRDINLAPVIATGGTITRAQGYIIHTFASPGTFAINKSSNLQYLIVGAGGRSSAGGGGGGGVLYGNTSITANSYPISIGGDLGGNGLPNWGPVASPAGSGGNSTFIGLTAYGGGGGGSQFAMQGGSGGGGGNNGGGVNPGGGGVAGQGNPGAPGTVPTGIAGGGGGAGAAASGVPGGDGRLLDITGTATYYGGGAASGSGTNGAGSGLTSYGGAGLRTGPGVAGSGVVVVRYVGANYVSLTRNRSNIFEGANITFTLTTLNVTNGTTLYYDIIGTNCLTTDFVTGNTGLMLITNNSNTLTLVATTPNKIRGSNLTIRVKTDSLSSEVLLSNTFLYLNSNLISNVDYLVVAGGGGGGQAGGGYGGGGGAGGLKTNKVQLVSATTYTVTVGGGGSNAGSQPGSLSSITAGPSTIVTTTGGSGGGNPGSTPLAGGSGGGGGNSPNSGLNGAAGTPGEGNPGGNGHNAAPLGGGGSSGSGGGGGGAGAAGSPGNAGPSAPGGSGGSGVYSNFSGATVGYAGGGTSGAGPGGGPSVGFGGGAAQSDGTTNTGGGGGGGNPTVSQAAGGSGIVILRYPNTLATAAATTGSPNVIYANANIIYRFWQSGTITF